MDGFLVINWKIVEPTGMFACMGLGILSIIPGCLILGSITHYLQDSQTPAAPSKSWASQEFPLQAAVASKASVVASLASWLLSCFALPRSGAACAALAAIGVHVYGGSQLPHWRLIQVLGGGSLFLLLQCEGWTLIGASLFINLINYFGFLMHLVGVGFAAGIIQMFGVLVLILSLFFYDASASSLVPAPAGSTRALVSNVFLLFALAHFPVVAWVTATGNVDFCSNRTAAWFLLLCMPVTHLVSACCIEGYSFVQPASGGFEFMLVQSYGWILVGLALTTQLAFVASGTCSPIVTLGLSFTGCALIALSVRYFRSPGKARQTRVQQALFQSSMLEKTAASGTAQLPQNSGPADLLMALAGGLGFWSAMVSSDFVPWPSVKGVAWMFVTTVVSCNIAGFHILWTWTHAVISLLIVTTGNEFWIGVCGVMGFTIAVPWYVMLARFWRLSIQTRTLSGWGPWVIEACGFFLGDLGGWRPSQINRQATLIGFHLIDIGVHLIPPLILLQASAMYITPPSVASAHMLSRGWFFWVGRHHYQFCPRDLAKGKMRPTKFKSFALARDRSCRSLPAIFLSRWIRFEGLFDPDVFNFMYGIQPPAPREVFDLAMTSEFVSTAILFCISCLPPERRAHIFLCMGAGHMISIRAMTFVAVVLVIIGVAFFVVGAVLSYRGHVKERAAAQPQQADVGVATVARSLSTSSEKSGTALKTAADQGGLRDRSRH
jgi:hypothetical protein